MTRHLLTAIVLVLLLTAPESSGQSKYMEDFEFLKKTVGQHGAAIKSKNIDWKEVCRIMKPAFAECGSDVKHVANVMRMLAFLRDSHTGVTSHKVDAKKLPQYAEGLFGAGLWFAWEKGRFMLRGVADKHPKAGELELGAALVAVDNVPIWLAMEREKRRMCRHFGSSTDHFLFTSLAVRLLPFKEKQQVEITLLGKGGKSKRVKVGRWGPGGRGFSVAEAQLPDGLKWQEHAVSTMLKTSWSKKVGYLRITGSMKKSTVDAVHKAFDELKGMEALLLDCRFMGGGNDESAWNIAGRLFDKATANGNQRKITPTGSWQFTGPVVMLQNENEVSSAETFTWAVTETERVISVGRTTGGWGIIPRGYSCPSGLISFRLGVNDRGTPIKGIHTEGVGWPPDIEIPYGPLFCSSADPAQRVGLEVLQVLAAGHTREQVLGPFQQLAAGNFASFTKSARVLRKKAKNWKPDLLQNLFHDDLKATLRLEISLLKSDAVLAPDLVGLESRNPELERRAKAARLTKDLKQLKSAKNKFKKELAAQESFLKTADHALDAPEKTQRAFVKKHGKTMIGKWVKENLWQ